MKCCTACAVPVQCNEIWSFCYAKEKNVTIEMRGRFGFRDVWTWVAIDAEAKLVASWLVGERDLDHAINLLTILPADWFTACSRRQTDIGLLEAVEGAFGSEIDYTMLQKLYAAPLNEGPARYSPAHCCGTKRQTIMGDPDPTHVSTS